MPEAYVRGNTIKYLRVPDEVIDKVKEESHKQQGVALCLAVFKQDCLLCTIKVALKTSPHSFRLAHDHHLLCGLGNWVTKAVCRATSWNAEQ